MTIDLPTVLIFLAALLGGSGLYLALPSSWHHLRRWGSALALVGLLLVAALLARPLGSLGITVHFYILALTAVSAAFMAVTARNPVYSALWFGLVLLSVAGLFLLIGAQFLAAATVVVYAGAILVTLLFVVMLAQQAGAATYDRLAREPFIAAAVGTVFGVVVLLTVLKTEPANRSAASTPQESVANLGAGLFTDHLISIEVAGTLLLVALVAAVCIAGRSKTAAQPSDRQQENVS